ncbi:MAG: hypothetical protein DRJ03_01935 [Chloroflexi bacterium]|nr:MAG: hypothetical protein DRJ03_01935 [Chloroflexota bacterium]
MAVKGKFVPVSKEKLARYEHAIKVAGKNSAEINVLAKPMLWLIRCYRLLWKEWDQKTEELWEATEYKPMLNEYRERNKKFERWLRELIKDIASRSDVPALERRTFRILRELNEESAQPVSVKRAKN